VHQIGGAPQQASSGGGRKPAGGGGGGKKVLFVKGAPDRLLPMCAHQMRSDSVEAIGAGGKGEYAPLDAQFWLTQQEELSSQGLRVLALCRCALDAASWGWFGRWLG